MNRGSSGAVIRRALHLVIIEPNFMSLNRTLRQSPLFALLLASPVAAQQPLTESPYKIVRSVRVGGEGGTDYIFADVAGRRLYIPRGGTRAVPATDSTPAKPAVPGRITIFDLETIAPLGEIPGTGG